ncbi:MAG: hypothetical protein RL148_1424 [Planctomycetota bacterium]|jgi:hypothetical protein
MALLDRDDVGRLLQHKLLFSLGLLLATVAGCSVLGSFGGKKTFAFSHKVHAEQGMECSDCHMDWESSDQPGMPALAQCNLCHENLEKENPERPKVATLFNEAGYLAARVTKLGGDVIFSHKQHAVVEGMECTSCHEGIAENDVVDASLAVSMADCTKCHVEQAKPNECATCHTDIRADKLPPNHDGLWKRFHGRVVRSDSTATADNCSLCHTESSCVQCHMDEQPANHNNYFRLRGHGLIAQMDRESCSACHRADSCDSCHAETRPLSHNANFGGTRSNHCTGCHLPLTEGNSCTTCHKDTPSHRLATPKPPGHSPAMDCRQCHGRGQALPHVDNGMDCNACHR